MKRRIRFFSLTALAGLLGTLGVVGVASPAAAATIVVNPGESIQAAVDAANAGDTILVKGGTYEEAVEISKNNLSLVGESARIVPPATIEANFCNDPSAPEDATGICVHGKPGTGTPVNNVRVEGMTVRGFAYGVFTLVANGTLLRNNIFRASGEYGVFANSSTNTRMEGNLASGFGEAGFYVGDSPDAGADLINNESAYGDIGVFIRNANGVYMAHNYLHDNCVGAVVLADAPGPAGDVLAENNDVDRNSRVCPASEEAPPISGIGFALLGAHDVNLRTNTITRNRPGGPTFASGGVLVASQGPDSTAPSDIVVQFNALSRNTPDLAWDETGTHIVFRRNACRDSTPAGLCN